MRQVKNYLLMAVLLFMYVMVLLFLLKSYRLYQNGYQSLSRLISHPSLEVLDGNIEVEE